MDDVFRVDAVSVDWVGQELGFGHGVSSSIGGAVDVGVVYCQGSAVHGENNFNTS